MPEAGLDDPGAAPASPAPAGGTTAPTTPPGTQVGGGSAAPAPGTGTTEPQAGRGETAATPKPEPIRFGGTPETVRAEKEQLYQTKWQQEGAPAVRRAAELEAENAELRRQTAGRASAPQPEPEEEVPASRPADPRAEYTRVQQIKASWEAVVPGETINDKTGEPFTADEVLGMTRRCDQELARIAQVAARQRPAAAQRPSSPGQRFDPNAIVAEAERRAEAKASAIAIEHYERVAAAEDMLSNAFDTFEAGFPGGKDYLQDKKWAIPVEVTLPDGRKRTEMATRSRLCYLAAFWGGAQDPVAVLLQHDPKGMREMLEKQARAKVSAEFARTGGSAPGLTPAAASSMPVNSNPRLDATVEHIGSHVKPYGT